MLLFSVAALTAVCLLSSCSHAAVNCPCGWRVANTSELYTHRIYDDFSGYPDINNILIDARASAFNNQWMVYDYWQNSDNPNIRLNAKYESKNVRIKHGHLVMEQPGYSYTDLQAFKPVSIAGIQSRSVDIVNGTFRVDFKVTGANGGSCASFFWYHDDHTEIDIEAVTEGTSLVNNTINWTLQPSENSDGTKIPNATLSVPLSKDLDIGVYHEHRFDWDARLGIKYYLDGHLMHTATHHIPTTGGNLQLKLWADGNKWWSGIPSSTPVFMTVKSIVAYHNTSSTQTAWLETCNKAGGPSKKTICEAILEPMAHNNSGTIPLVNDSAVDPLNKPDKNTSHPLGAASPTSSGLFPDPSTATSFAIKNIPNVWSRLRLIYRGLLSGKHNSRKVEYLVRRNETIYTLPGGSPITVDNNGNPVSNRAIRLQPLSMFN